MARALPKTGPRRCRLLYVEHDAESLLHVEQLVAARKDLLLLRAASLHLAVEAARSKRPEVILIDIDVPDFDPIRSPGEIVKRLHADRALEAIPILALSVNASPAAIMKGLEAGFFQYLTKPIQAAAFTEALAFAREFAAIDRAEQAGVQPRAAKQPSKESR
ncbi:MAG TPA: response regulator [Burkholderiales bacterium]|nr:response regulator [Burkholderiales bacterium]